MPSRSVSDLDAQGHRSDIEIGRGTDLDGTGHSFLYAANALSHANELLTRGIHSINAPSTTLTSDDAGFRSATAHP